MSIITNLPTDMSYTTGQSGYNAFRDIGLFGITHSTSSTSFNATFNMATNEGVKCFLLSPSAFSEYSGVFNVSSTPDDQLVVALILVSDNQFAMKQYGYWNNTGNYRYYDQGSSVIKEFNGNSYHIKGTHARGNSEIYTLSSYYSGIYNVSSYDSISAGIVASGVRPIATGYPITYSFTNATVSGPSEAVPGDTVIVSAIPDTDYGITDASTQILVTNNDVAIPYTWDAATNHITFTMPDPT